MPRYKKKKRKAYNMERKEMEEIVNELADREYKSFLVSSIAPFTIGLVCGLLLCVFGCSLGGCTATAAPSRLGPVAFKSDVDYSTNNTALVETIEAVAPSVTVDYSTNNTALVETIEAVVPGQDLSDIIDRLAAAEAGIGALGFKCRVIMSKGSGSEGTSQLYWNRTGGSDFNGALYFDSGYTSIYDEEDEIELPIRSGYAFLGYYSSSSTSASGYRQFIDTEGKMNLNSDNVPDLVARMRSATTNVTIYAKWGSLYTITLNPNYSGSSSEETYKAYYCSSNGMWYEDNYGTFEISTNGFFNSHEPPSRDGFDFDGYYSSSSGGTLRIDVAGNILYQPTGTTTLYAHWTEAVPDGEDQ